LLPTRVPELLLSTSGTPPFLSVFPKWSPFISSGFFASGAGSRTFIFCFGNPAFFIGIPEGWIAANFGNIYHFIFLWNQEIIALLTQM
jgi:hypothetical protein